MYEEKVCPFNFVEATHKILYEYYRVIKKSISEKIIIYVLLAKKSLKMDIIINEINNEIKKIIKEELLKKHKDEFEAEDYNKLTNDLKYVKEKLYFK